MSTRFQLRRDTSTNWTTLNPILAAGEPGLETDTLNLKIGDGVSYWSALEYYAIVTAYFGTLTVATLQALPTVDPGVAGALFWNADTLCKSAG